MIVSHDLKRGRAEGRQPLTSIFQKMGALTLFLTQILLLSSRKLSFFSHIIIV